MWLCHDCSWALSIPTCTTSNIRYSTCNGKRGRVRELWFFSQILGSFFARNLGTVLLMLNAAGCHVSMFFFSNAKYVFVQNLGTSFGQCLLRQILRRNIKVCRLPARRIRSTRYEEIEKRIFSYDSDNPCTSPETFLRIRLVLRNTIRRNRKVYLFIRLSACTGFLEATNHNLYIFIYS
jgi:hypothetical protein